MKMILSYSGALMTLAVLDFIWIGHISRGFYQKGIGHLFRADMGWGAIVIFYLLYAGAIMYFAVQPSGGTMSRALIAGALLGFTVYMTYDLVNMATLKDWPLRVTLVDILWGTMMTSVSAVVGSLLYHL